MSGDPGSLPPQTIAGHTSHTRQSLGNLTAHLKLAEGQPDDPARAKLSIDLGDVEDARDRLLLWAGNLGAMRAPISRLSLDSRLAEAPEIRELICQHLTDLWEAADDLSGIVKGDSPNHEMADDDGQGPPDEATMLLEIITESVSSLFRIAILVRKAGPDDRFSRALKMSKTAFPESFDINHAREKYPKLRLRNAGLLVSRVGSAISKRRQFIKYSRDHRYRLGHDEVEDVPEPTATELLSSKASTFRPEMVPQGAAFSDALGQQQEEEEEEDAFSMTASTVSDPSAQVELPKLSDLSEDGRPFECPICFTLQCFQGERAWRIHAFRDLKAYVCTVGGKECDSQLFGDRNSWFEHEVRQHRAQYTCNLCNDGHLSSEQDLTAHVGTHHGIFERELLQLLLNASRQTPARIQAAECPFCEDWEAKLRIKANSANLNQEVTASQDGGPSPRLLVSLGRFKRHVAMHQEDLASFAVPRATENTGTGRRSSDGSRSTASISLAEWSPVASSPSPSQSPSRSLESRRPLFEPVDAPAGEAKVPPLPILTGGLDHPYLEPGFDSSSTVHPGRDSLRTWKEARKKRVIGNEVPWVIPPPPPPKSAEPGTDSPTNRDLEAFDDGAKPPAVTSETTRPRVQSHSMVMTPQGLMRVPNVGLNAAQIAAQQRMMQQHQQMMQVQQNDMVNGVPAMQHSRDHEPPRTPTRPTESGVYDELVDYDMWRPRWGLTREVSESEDSRKSMPLPNPPASAYSAESEAMVERIRKLEREKHEAEYSERHERHTQERAELAAYYDEKMRKKIEEEAAQRLQPTYTRMSLKHLDLETLIFYKIDWELDSDPDYVLIKRWVPEDEQIRLWEHTRRLRVEAERGRRQHSDDHHDGKRDDPAEEEDQKDADDGFTDVNQRFEKQRARMRRNEEHAHMRCFWRQYCSRGLNCTYGHTKEEEDQFQSYGTRKPKKYKNCTNDGCIRGKNCLFAHSLEELFCPTCEKTGQHEMAACPERYPSTRKNY